jgi:hypothetical protein
MRHCHDVLADVLDCPHPGRIAGDVAAQTQQFIEIIKAAIDVRNVSSGILA